MTKRNSPDFTDERAAWHMVEQERHSLKTWTGILDWLSEGACGDNPVTAAECGALSKIVGEWMDVRELVLELAASGEVERNIIISRIEDICVESKRSEQ